MASSQDRAVPSEPGDRRHGSIVWVTVAGDTITGDGGGIVVVRNLFGLSSSFQRKYNGCDQLRLLWASLSCVLKD